MEHTKELMQEDLRSSYEAYKAGTTNKETYLEQKAVYEQLTEKLYDNITRQQEAVSELADIDVPVMEGFEMLEGKIQMTMLTKELVDVFVDKIVVYGEREIDVKWKFMCNA